MFDVQESPTGIAYRVDIWPRVARLIRPRVAEPTRPVACKKPRKSRRRLVYRSIVTDSMLKHFCGISACSSDGRPVIIETPPEGEARVGNVLTDMLVSTLEEYPKFRPALWRYTSRTERIRAAYYQQAVDATGSGYTFTVNLAPHVARRLLERGLTDLNASLKAKLEQHVGRRVEYYVVLETSIDPGKHGNGVYDYRKARPHLHGALTCSAEEVPRVKLALHAVNRGATATFEKPRAVKVDKVTDGFGWSQYILKHKTFCRLGLPNGHRRILASSIGLRKDAERLYERDRAVLLDQITSIKRKA